MCYQEDDPSEKLKTIKNTVNQMLEQAHRDSQNNDDADYFWQFVKLMNLISAAILENNYKQEQKQKLEAAKRYGERNAKRVRKELEANTNRQIDEYLDLIRDIEHIFELDGKIEDVNRQYTQSMNELKGRKDEAVKDVEGRMKAGLNNSTRHGESNAIWDVTESGKSKGSDDDVIILQDADFQIVLGDEDKTMQEVINHTVSLEANFNLQINVKSNKCVRNAENNNPLSSVQSDIAFKNDNMFEKVETDDDLLYENAGNARYANNARASEYSENTKDARKVRNAEISEEAAPQEEDSKQSSEIVEAIKSMTPDQKVAIRIMCEDGWSEWTKIAADAMENYKENVKTEATLRSHFTQLINKGFVEKTKIQTAGTANLGLYRLTDKGKESFKYLYGKDAVMPEMDRIIIEHSTLDMGTESFILLL